MNWDDLKIFLMVYREKSFSEASRKLKVSQSTISRRISSLEKALGVRLFDRTPSGLMPTEVAMELIPEVESMEYSAIELTRLSEGRETLLEGTVRVAVADGMSSNLLAPLLPEFTRRYPHIRLELVSGSALIDLSRREADIALRFVKPLNGDLVFRRAAHSEYGLYASPSYIKSLHKTKDLKKLDWLTWDSSLSHLPEAAWFEKHINVSPRLRSTHMDTLFNAAIAGLGVMLIPKIFASWISFLEEVPLQIDIQLSIDIWLVGHRTLQRTPKTRAVWKFLEELMLEIQEKTLATSKLFAKAKGPSSWLTEEIIESPRVD